MNKTPDSHKLSNLQELDVLLPREIRGQSHTIPRIVSAVRRGELGLTKPSRPRGSFLLLGPTGVGKTETVVVTTNHVFGDGKLFRFDMSEFQNQEALGLLLGARLGEIGYLGAVRERAAEGSLLFDEAEKAHPRVLDILLQLLDAARLTVATGQTLDFSGFYVWLTSNIGSAELMSLQHSNEATLERHVLTRAQQALRPEIFARVNEKLVFHRLSYEHQLEIAEKFLPRNRIPRCARSQDRTRQNCVAVSCAEGISPETRRAPDARCRGEARRRRGDGMPARRSLCLRNSRARRTARPPRRVLIQARERNRCVSPMSMSGCTAPSFRF
jgi:ATP-dependent Clp protease ATP-binding subunit ClpA